MVHAVLVQLDAINAKMIGQIKEVYSPDRYKIGYLVGKTFDNIMEYSYNTI